MIQSRYTITTDATHEIEAIIQRFERDLRDRGADIKDYLPLEADPSYCAVVTELSRIELEHSFDQGQQPNASRYIEAFPEVFEQQNYLAQLVFEEYRLRSWAGQHVDAAALAEKYGVDISRWPKLGTGSRSGAEAEPTRRRYEKSELALPVIRYPRVGETFAGYPLVDRLGEGAFSRVFLARQPDLAGRPVVLKVTPLETDESDRLARLQHSAIIPVYSVHRDADLSCICMPFLGATTLADLSPCGERWASLDGPADELVSTILDRRRSTIAVSGESKGNVAYSQNARDDVASELNTTPRHDGWANALDSREDVGLTNLSKLGYVEALLTLVTGAVEGLAHAHQRGIVHRDLKPANILVTDSGSPVLLDFNLAIASQEPKTRIVGGTLPYMSPQQLASLETGESVDASDDVFSVGVILYELLSGRLPFPCPAAGEPFELAELIDDRCTKPPSIRSHNRGASVGLEAIISRCLSSDRADRYHDAGELLEDLNRHRQHRPLRYAPNRSLFERLSKWSARHPRISSASSVASFALLGLLLCGLLIQQRGVSIATMRAEANLQDLQSRLPGVVASLSTPGREPEILQAGLNDASQTLSGWLTNHNELSADAGLQYIDRESQASVQRQLAQLAYLMAEAEADIGLQLAADEPNRSLRQQQSRKWSTLSSELAPQLSTLVEHQVDRVKARYEGLPIPAWSEDDLKLEQIDLQTIAAAESSDALLLLALSKKQLQQQPSNVSFWFYAAVANARLGRWDAAISCLDVCDAIQPNSVATIFNRGLCYLQNGNAGAARDDFSACLSIRPEMMTARFNRAVAAERTGDLESSLSDLDKLVQTGLATTRMVLMRASVHEQLGNAQAAAADRQGAMTIPPRDSSDWVARGVVRLADSPQDALQDFLSALRLAPADFHALQNAAHVYAERLDDPKHAIEMLDRLIVAWPSNASAVASRGILYARTGRVEEAIEDVSAAIRRQPGPREQLQIAGIYALIMGQVDDVSVPADDDSVPANKDAKRAALHWLGHALRNDPSLATTAAGDADLESLNDDASFRRLIESATTLELLSQ